MVLSSGLQCWLHYPCISTRWVWSLNTVHKLRNIEKKKSWPSWDSNRGSWLRSLNATSVQCRLLGVFVQSEVTLLGPTLREYNFFKDWPGLGVSQGFCSFSLTMQCLKPLGYCAPLTKRRKVDTSGLGNRSRCVYQTTLTFDKFSRVPLGNLKWSKL